MSDYRIIETCGRRHVIVPSRCRGKIEEPNYLGTGLALTGVMHRKETIEHFLIRTKKKKKSC
jgi:hypothetical protein